MIGNFSSFIELCAAVYFTMCLDSDKFKLFWNPDRKVKVDDTSIQTTIDESVEKTRDNEILGLRRMGVFMIVICFLMLVLVGFEEKMSVEPNYLIVPFVYSCGLVFIIELIHNAVFKIMKVVVLSVFIVLGFFLVLWFYRGLNDWLHFDLINRLYEYAGFLTTFILLFPLAIHVVRLWLRSSVQRGYLRTKIDIENEEYYKAIDAVIAGRPAGVSKKYLDALNDITNPKDPDPDTTPFTELYVSSIVKELYPSDIKLLWSFGVNLMHRGYNFIKRQFEKDK